MLSQQTSSHHESEVVWNWGHIFILSQGPNFVAILEGHI